jgi:hypothetical protein
MIKQAAILLVLAVPSGAQEDSARTWKDREGSSVPPVAGRPALIAAGDWQFTGFYERDGSLHHWVRGFELISGTPDEKRIYKMYISGGYAVISARQEAYNKWIKDNDLASHKTIPSALPVNGCLTLRTLHIPRYRFTAELDVLWRSYQTDCAAADPKNFYAACRMTLLEYRRAKKPLSYPNGGLDLRAGQLSRLAASIDGFDAEVESLRKLTVLTDKPVDKERLAAYREEDHLEPDQLPSGFLAKLENLERGIREDLDDAALLRKSLR